MTPVYIKHNNVLVWFLLTIPPEQLSIGERKDEVLRILNLNFGTEYKRQAVDGWLNKSKKPPAKMLDYIRAAFLMHVDYITLIETEVEYLRIQRDQPALARFLLLIE